MLNRCIMAMLFFVSAANLFANDLSQLIDLCDEELFAPDCEINDAVLRAKEIIKWGKENNSLEVECRGLIRFVFAELHMGRWRNDWEEKRKRALTLARNLDNDSLALAEVLMLDGCLKSHYLNDFEGGVKDLRYAIAIGEANIDLQILARAHFLLALTVKLRGDTFYGHEYSLRSANLAKILDMKNLEYSALKLLLLIRQDARFDMSKYMTRYQNLCEELGFPVDISPDVEITVEEMIQTVQDTRHSITKEYLLEESEIKDDSLEATNLASVQKELLLASLYLVDYYGVRQGNWSQAEPYIEIFDLASRHLRDRTNQVTAQHYQAVSLARKGEIEAANAITKQVIDTLTKAEDIETLIEIGTELSRAYTAGGAIQESSQLLDFVEEQRVLLNAKLPELSEKSVDQYCDLILTKLEARNTAETHEKTISRTRTVNIALTMSLLLAACLWLWQRAHQSRRMQKELRRKLDHKTKSLKRATRMAQKANQAKSDYLARINHELRNPLGAIVNSCEILDSENNQIDQQTARIARKTISAASGALVDIIDDVLDFTRIEAGQLELRPSTFSPLELIASVCTITKSYMQDGVDLVTDVSPDLPKQIRADLPKLRQTILNLCNNAAKHTKDGQVTLSVDYESSEDQNESDVLIVRVEDTGSGIEAEHLPKVFDRFLRIGDCPGSGLGLYISSAFAKCMGGDIQCLSKMGVGTTMILRVPVIQEEENVRDHVRTRSLDHPSHSAKRILVIDDIEANAESLAALLSSCGFQSQTALSWEDAEPAIRIGVDSVLLDLRMPKIDGFELARRIRSMNGSTPVPKIIAVSGDATQTIREKVKAAGFDGFLPKPCTLDEIMASI